MFTANEEKFLKNFIKKCEELGIGPFDAARASQVIQTHKANHSTVPAGDHSHSAKVVLD